LAIGDLPRESYVGATCIVLRFRAKDLGFHAAWLMARIRSWVIDFALFLAAVLAQYRFRQTRH